MIIEAIVNFFFRILIFIIDWLPAVTLPADLLASISQISGWIAWANYYLPLETAGAVFAVLLGCYPTLMFIHFCIK